MIGLTFEAKLFAQGKKSICPFLNIKLQVQLKLFKANATQGATCHPSPCLLGVVDPVHKTLIIYAMRPVEHVSHLMHYNISALLEPGLHWVGHCGNFGVVRFVVPSEGKNACSIAVICVAENVVPGFAWVKIGVGHCQDAVRVLWFVLCELDVDVRGAELQLSAILAMGDLMLFDKVLRKAKLVFG